MSTYDPNYQSTKVLYRVGQKVVVFNPAGEVLVLRRSNKTSRAGGWDFPGGALEHEQPLTGILREAEEEAAIAITNVRPVVALTTALAGETEPVLTIGYVADTTTTEVTISWEHDQFQWLRPVEALQLPWPGLHKDILQAAIAAHATAAQEGNAI